MVLTRSSPREQRDPTPSAFRRNRLVSASNDLASFVVHLDGRGDASHFVFGQPGGSTVAVRPDFTTPDGRGKFLLVVSALTRDLVGYYERDAWRVREPGTEVDRLVVPDGRGLVARQGTFVAVKVRTGAVVVDVARPEHVGELRGLDPHDLSGDLLLGRFAAIDDDARRLVWLDQELARPKTRPPRLVVTARDRDSFATERTLTFGDLGLPIPDGLQVSLGISAEGAMTVVTEHGVARASAAGVATRLVRRRKQAGRALVLDGALVMETKDAGLVELRPNDRAWRGIPCRLASRDATGARGVMGLICEVGRRAFAWMDGDSRILRFEMDGDGWRVRIVARVVGDEVVLSDEPWQTPDVLAVAG